LTSKGIFPKAELLPTAAKATVRWSKIGRTIAFGGVFNCSTARRMTSEPGRSATSRRCKPASTPNARSRSKWKADGARKSEGPIGAMTLGNGASHPDPAEQRGARAWTNFEEGPMSEPTSSTTMSPKLAKVMELARKDPGLRLRSLAHVLDEQVLTRSFHQLRKDAAVGVDEVTTEE
jgi:hypothetical protein